MKELDDETRQLLRDPHWDDELVSLINRVMEQFGEDAFKEALERAFVELKKHEVRPASPRGIAIADEALRTELRRLARPM